MWARLVGPPAAAPRDCWHCCPVRCCPAMPATAAKLPCRGRCCLLAPSPLPPPESHCSAAPLFSAAPPSAPAASGCPAAPAGCSAPAAPLHLGWQWLAGRHGECLLDPLRRRWQRDEGPWCSRVRALAGPTAALASCPARGPAHYCPAAWQAGQAVPGPCLPARTPAAAPPPCPRLAAGAML